MPMRDSTSSPSPQIQGMMASAVLSNSAALKCRCSSRSDSMQLLRNPVRLIRFGNEHRQGRNIGIPFDQRGPRAETPQGGSVETPHRFRHVRAVAIDPYRVLSDAVDHMTSQVKLLYRSRRYPIKVGARVEPVVHRADVEIVDVEQNAATGPVNERRQEFPLRDLRAGEPKIARDVLDKDLALEIVLHLTDTVCHVMQRFLGV